MTTVSTTFLRINIVIFCHFAWWCNQGQSVGGSSRNGGV